MVNRLYVSFWDLCLDNLPQGRFERRMIGAGDANLMIRAALLAMPDSHRFPALRRLRKDPLALGYGSRALAYTQTDEQSVLVSELIAVGAKLQNILILELTVGVLLEFDGKNIVPNKPAMDNDFGIDVIWPRAWLAAPAHFLGLIPHAV